MIRPSNRIARPSCQSSSIDGHVATGIGLAEAGWASSWGRFPGQTAYARMPMPRGPAAAGRKAPGIGYPEGRCAATAEFLAAFAASLERPPRPETGHSRRENFCRQASGLSTSHFYTTPRDTTGRVSEVDLWLPLPRGNSRRLDARVGTIIHCHRRRRAPRRPVPDRQWPRDARQSTHYPASRRMLYAMTERWKPLSEKSPTASASTRSSSVPRKRLGAKI